jgi:hypothetical protein
MKSQQFGFKRRSQQMQLEKTFLATAPAGRKGKTTNYDKIL